MDSIINKAKKYVESDSFQKKVEAKVDEIMLRGNSFGKRIRISGTAKAANKFIEVLQKEIQSHAVAEGGGGLNGRGLGATAVSALTKLHHKNPTKIGKYQYQIEVWFSEDLRRDSLAPDYFDEGIDNIAALLNKGYPTTRHTVYGTWAGHGYADSFNIPSLRQREGLHFIENAVREYMAAYSKEYGVIDINVNDVYEIN